MNELLTAEEMRRRTELAERYYAEAKMEAVDDVVRLVLKYASEVADIKCSTVRVPPVAYNIIKVPLERFGREGTLRYDYVIKDGNDPVVSKLKELGYKVTYLNNSLGGEIEIEW